MHRKEVWAVLIVVVGAAAILLYSAAHAIGQVLTFQDVNGSAADQLTGVDTSTWQAYHDGNDGFSLEYPPNWQIFTGGLLGTEPFIEFGNPLNGTTTYVLEVFIESNPSNLSSGEYVHQMLAAYKAGNNQVASFEKSFLLNIGPYNAYELYKVFEFDHDAEQIYMADGTSTLRFDFPIADANPNLASPANNNAIAHMIINTLTFGQ